MLRVLSRIAPAIAVAFTPAALAEPVSSVEPHDTPRPEPVTRPSDAGTAVVAEPGAESGRVDDGDGGDSVLRRTGRYALFVPKLVLEVAFAPVRGGIWVWDRYHPEELYERAMFNDARTIGVYPVLGYDTGYGASGVTGGARFVDRDLFGDHEHLALVAATGSMYHQSYSAELRSGDRLGHRVSALVEASYEQRPHDTFYGIGNGNLVAATGMPIDPRASSTAVGTYYHQQRTRVDALGDVRAVSDLHLRISGAVSRIDFGPGDLGTPTDDVYDTAGLVGWNGVSYAYGETELRWDSRRAANPFEPRSVYSVGSLVSAFGGIQHPFSGGRDFGRYGFDLQHFFRIGEGPRVIAVRAHGEGVTGSLDDVPFTELPQLGGWTYLRGYPLDRFRDRVAAFGSVEYRWDLADLVGASLFADAGRVYDAPDAVTLSGMRVGYGFALELHTEDSFVLETSVASSIDGGLLFSLAFDPVFDMQERVRRR